jgi:hypothetical protein
VRLVKFAAAAAVNAAAVKGNKLTLSIKGILNSAASSCC